MRIVLTGGGSGGHLTPLVSVADTLKRMYHEGEISFPESRNSGLEIRYVGVVTEIDKSILEKADIPYEHIPSGKIRRYLSGAPLTAMEMFVQLPFGILRAFWRMYILMPEVVFSKGGYGSIPVVIASWVYRIPILMHETDIVPGLSNKKLSRFASAIVVGFRKAEQYFKQDRVFVAGTPLREIFYKLPDRETARRELQLHDRKPVLFVTGGSQGAQRINNVILEMLIRVLPDFQVVHQVGQLNLEPVQEFVRSTLGNFPDISDYHVLGFIDERTMANCFSASDLVVSRAGGTTLAELAVAGKPSVLIPLGESANNHQWENAYFYREAGAAVVLDESNVSPPLLEATIRRVFQRQSNLELMSSRVRELARPSASIDIAQLLVQMGLGFVPRRKLEAVKEK
ncbi:MAG: UDP-N-acetylglucosamine--N-acetylmuramyl-(pentapeptide) pyrophosphoryl-undecaprenol N-acetylglucosamine transferase [bacterium]|nr:UDP-N-acetylglucosamine--N-acetylmuramyl-(pentapeptide) pyrophosphoryl-undecaprenol N-acetylglucosamine transferase [bacterium]